MQTDPVGYKDGLNWYDYVHNDPVNQTDPTGDVAGVDDAAEGVILLGVGAVYVGAVILHDENTQHAIENGVHAAGDFLGGLIHHNDQGPALPDKPVGDQPRDGKGNRTNSGPLHPDNGGTGDSEKDFDKLTGGRSGPAPGSKGYPPGTQVGDNGVAHRPGTATKGPRIDIPASGDRKHETLHYPPVPPPPPPPKQP